MARGQLAAWCASAKTSPEAVTCDVFKVGRRVRYSGPPLGSHHIPATNLSSCWAYAPVVMHVSAPGL